MAGGLIALSVAILLVDYAVASWRGPRDDQTIKALQVQVKSDASLAPTLAAVQKGSTDARRGRKFRDNVLAWVLILASAIFLTAAKQVVQTPHAWQVVPTPGGAANPGCSRLSGGLPTIEPPLPWTSPS